MLSWRLSYSDWEVGERVRQDMAALWLCRIRLTGAGCPEWATRPLCGAWRYGCCCLGVAPRPWMQFILTVPRGPPSMPPAARMQ